MTTRKFKFEKLVRDKIVDGIKEAGNTPVYHKLNDEDFIYQLKQKVLEEAVEVPREEDREELLKEIADVQEVIDNLIEALGSSKEEVAEIQKKKNEKAGSFKKRLYVKHVITKPDSEWVEYYLSSPDKYPEITEED